MRVIAYQFVSGLLGLFCALCSSAALQAEEQQLSATITPFPGAASAAYSLSIEGGLREHVSIAAPALQERDLRATFVVIPGLTPKSVEDAAAKEPGSLGSVSWPEWRELTKAGHGFANGSWSHPYLTKIDDSRLHREVVKARQAIARKLGVDVRAFAYPFGARNKDLDKLVLQHHEVIRPRGRALGGVSFSLDGHHRWIAEGISEGHWRVGVVKGIGDDQTGIDPQAFLDHLDWLRERQDRLWIAPLADVAAWLARRETISAQALRAGDAITVTVTEGEDADPKPLPITVLITVPGLAAYRTVTATQDGQTVPVVVRVREQQVLVTCAVGAAPARIVLSR